jgi:outer membrane protein assembly factor BamA
MANLHKLISIALFHFVFGLMTISLSAQNSYQLKYSSVDRDTVYLKKELGLETVFTSRILCVEYVNKLPGLLQTKGYVTASIDKLRFDSLSATIELYLGLRYRWADIITSKADETLLLEAGWRSSSFRDRQMDFKQFQLFQERILNDLENKGHPFAKVFLDSIVLKGDAITARLQVQKGPLYKIDSIRVYGDLKISNFFLQRYLDISNNSIYNKEKLQRIGKKISELSFAEEERPSNLSLLGTGSVLNLYLKQKRSSQINVLLGFLPNNDQLTTKKLLVTGEANIHLRNSLGAGESLGLNWQQIQVNSPRLNIYYRQPYILNSNFGIDFNFDMFRKDTTFLNVNLQLGTQYMLSANKSGKLYFQRFQTIVNGVNKNFILQNRRLPDQADITSSSIGLDYDYNNTNYRLNPRSGNQFGINFLAGTKTIKKNNEILELKDPSDPQFDFDRIYDNVKLKTYILKLKANATRFFPLGKLSTLKAGVNMAVFQSGNIFRNELFQVGGYKLLRGFDEESQYLSQYVIASAEYRYLVGVNSFFFLFADGGWGRNNSQNANFNYNYLSSGLGLALETKAGIFNLAWAVGRRNDLPFSLRQSKIHIGLVNYF